MLHTMARHTDVDLMSLVHDEEEASHASDLKHVAATVQIARVPRLRNYARAALMLPSARPLTHLLLDSPGALPALEHVIRAHPPDVVFAFCSGMMRFAMIPPLAGVPCVLDMVDADSAKWRAMSDTASGPRRYLYGREARCLAAFEIAAMRHARATLAVNDREVALLRELDPAARVRVMENGVDVTSFARPAGWPPKGAGEDVPSMQSARNGPSAAVAPTPPEAVGSPTIVFCGVMNYAPNEAGALWLAREVWPLVSAARPDAKLMIVGSSPTAAVQALAGPSIVVTGAVPDVRRYLWNAAAATAPLWIARGVQNKVLEAVAAGLPCVVTPAVAAGLPSVLMPACPVADNAQTFAQHLIDLLNVSAEARRASAEAIDLGQLSWSARLTGLMPLLTEAAAARR
jgi:glycosyltransferase involved in cell wall biosynthesis